MLGDMMIVHRNCLKLCFGTPTPPPATDTCTSGGVAISPTSATTTARAYITDPPTTSNSSTSTWPKWSHRQPSRYADFVTP